MPFYDFVCKKCGTIVEEFCPTYRDRPPHLTCPSCFGECVYEIAPVRTDFKHTDREVRVPSNPVSVWMGGRRK